MLKGYKGRIITANANLVSSTSSSGIWQLEEAIQGTSAVAGGGGSGFALATGGTLTTATIGGFPHNIHTFTTTGSNSINFSSGGTIQVLLVGAGGGGGSLGGGGAGGAVINASGTVTTGTYSLSVGTGGSGALSWSTCCTAGSDTTGFGITCYGGGSGCSYSAGCLNTYNTSSQGNFGGRCYYVKDYTSSPGTPGLPGGWTGTVYSGYLGGTHTGSCCPCNGAGGAGAGGAGSNYDGPPNGGPGVLLNFTGSSYYWAGGGGGSGYCSQVPGNGGSGGGGGGGSTYSTYGTGGTGGLNSGGNGTGPSDPSVGGAGGNNTGSGGGAGSTGNGYSGANGGNGGSGIIIVRYRTS